VTGVTQSGWAQKRRRELYVGQAKAASDAAPARYLAEGVSFLFLVCHVPGHPRTLITVFANPSSVRSGARAGSEI